MATMPQVWYKGVVMAGPPGGTLVDVSCDVTALTITRSRETIDLPATACTGQTGSLAGSGSDEVEIEWLQGVGVDRLSTLAATAIASPTAELEMSVQYAEGTVSATNPKYEFVARVVELPLGGTVGELLVASATWPIVEASLTTVTTP